MTQQSRPLPEFDNPPVSEVALAVQFSPLENWHSPHAGLYWGKIQTQYPITEVQSPFPSQIEKFGEEFWQRPSVRLELVKPDVTRFWFLDEGRINLVQVQRDRFVTNWRKVQGNEVYPRYEDSIRPRFEREWTGFHEFLQDKKIGDPKVNQCEITYVNDIPIGEGAQAFADSLKLFSSWWGPGTDDFLQAPESLSVGGSFQLPDERGRLHFASQHVRRQTDNARVVQLRLTARGKPLSGNEVDVMNWMDMGREWIVRAFADLTSPEAHKLWGRKQ